ncbi:MAG: uracil-DNA glycosylase [Bdellovibrionales bacterium]|jgi:hypothetical protein|nr:uracil-DNA glycosylase [Bdellovibrionales bacterium]MBT3525787.1 uracil-DNA glycosylase [Bdellovibrionales bacterium]MBT7767524.1 uracil-DNA glycosylase [Bdellovibrionales bacterium]
MSESDYETTKIDKRSSKVNCRNCQYYYITWIALTPHGCRRHGFESKMMPHLLVKKESNQDCLAFEEKKSRS